MKLALSHFLPFTVVIPSLMVGLFFHTDIVSDILIGFELVMSIFPITSITFFSGKIGCQISSPALIISTVI